MVRRFPFFNLDTANQCILRENQRIQLTPKAYAVLHYLVEHPGRIVKKEELLDAAWPDTFVQEGVLKSCILDLRKALGDDAKNAQCIATIHRRGYRFDAQEIDASIGASELTGPGLSLQNLAAPQPSREIEGVGGVLGAAVRAPADDVQADAGLIGRDAVVARLHSLWEHAAAGHRQIVFVTGEPGIGKSTLIDHFLADAVKVSPAPVLRGQCIEQFGAREAYYPVFEALTRGVRNGSIPVLSEVLRKYAPAWLMQMPGTISPEDRESLKQEILGATRERMLREIGEAIEVLVSDRLLVLVLEDLHWCDLSTLDLISSIANRTEAAKLLVLASYRPADVIIGNHPLKSVKQNLLARQRCVEIELGFLSTADIAAMLERRFPKHRFGADFAALVHARTEGNPLFVHNLLDFAVSHSLIAENHEGWTLTAAFRASDFAFPESLSATIETQVERLTLAEQTLLEAASVAGNTFAIPLIAADDPDAAASAEDCCEQMARRNIFIRPCSFAGGGRITAEYQFAHALYRDVLYRRISPLRRVRLHQTLGERLERMSAARLPEVAAELAVHFQESRDHPRGIRYLRLVAQRSAGRHALHEAVDALERALALAGQLNGPDKGAMELELTEQLGLLYRLMGQLTSSELEFEKMRELAAETEDREAELRAQLQLAGVASFLDRARCLKAAEDAVALCGEPMRADLRRHALGQAAYWNLLFRGWKEADASASARALETARSGTDRAAVALHASRHAFFLALSSRYRDACDTAEEGIRIATEIESLLDSCIGYYFEAWALLHAGDWGKLQTLLRTAIERARRNGNELWVLLFGLLESFLHIQAFSFDYARETCREHLDRARALGHPLSIQISHVLLGLAELGAGDFSKAARSFDEIRNWQSRERILMDWIWKLPLALGVTELRLATGDIESARQEADSFVSLASATEECTWIGLSHYARARVAVAGADRLMACNELSKGLAAIEGREAPLAEWRLGVLAAQVQNREEDAAKARKVIGNIADSLLDFDPLKISFLSSAMAMVDADGVFHAGT